MYLHSFRIKNFRRLKDAYIDLEKELTIFVGANNSGKTSAIHAIQMFLDGSRDKFSIHDFSCDCWAIFEQIGADETAAEERLAFPTISIDLWFEVEADDLHRVLDLLPSLEWNGSLVGIRMEYGPKDQEELLANYRQAKDSALGHVSRDQEARGNYHPWPRTLRDYLTKKLKSEYQFRYYVLDKAHFDSIFKQNTDYQPLELVSDKERNGHRIVNSLLKVDFLSAQRYLADGTSQARAEDLSKCLSRFYTRNLEQHSMDHQTLRALSDSEEELSKHLSNVFGGTLEKLSQLGYPGLANPRLQIKSALRLERLVNDHHAKVHYMLGESGEHHEEFTLPDSYNGLGFKNLIYMVVELLDLHVNWIQAKEGKEETRPPLHLIFIEEPEAHMHAQLQQAFIRKVFELLEIQDSDGQGYRSQLAVTTHSPHILYERGFKPIRYFRRSTAIGPWQSSEILNLSAFYDENEEDRDFLERYMKLTHCDLFFADATILVEGNVERLLLPLMIGRSAPRLKSAYLSILEVGGAFAHRFKRLIEFLGLTTLIITDIDSVHPSTESSDSAEDIDGNRLDDSSGSDEDEQSIAKKSCMVGTPGAVTSNRTLIDWLPGKSSVTELLAATDTERTDSLNGHPNTRVHVAYQSLQKVIWNREEKELAGRTLEESFALQNLTWCQEPSQRTLGLNIRGASQFSLNDLAEKIFKRVKSSYFKKTDFALGILADTNGGWTVPIYIRQGLEWLELEVLPREPQLPESAVEEEPELAEVPE
jgi:predicted ATP-dependent endonuclease of OLD family